MFCLPLWQGTCGAFLQIPSLQCNAAYNDRTYHLDSSVDAHVSATQELSCLRLAEFIFLHLFWALQYYISQSVSVAYISIYN